jgi:hypothetical protein
VSVTVSCLNCVVNRTNRQGLEEEKFSEADWCNLLSISHRYDCGRARERSIKEINKLDPPVSDTGRIVMAKKFELKEWLLPACVGLVERQDPLSYTEAEELGLEMTVLLSQAREEYIHLRRNQEIINTFGQRITLLNKPDTTQLVMEVLNIQ